MTKDVLLTIAGLHATDGETDDMLETIVPAQYYLKNGKQYLIFEEALEGLEGKIKSTLKFSANQVELLRSGAASTRMVFEKNREHAMIYQTPMGPLQISVHTKELEILEEPTQIYINIEYDLKSGGIVVTESSLRMHICQKECMEDRF